MPHLPAFFISLKSVSSPLKNNRVIMPSMARDWNSRVVKLKEKVCNSFPRIEMFVPENLPSKYGPKIIPANISPITAGCFNFSNK